MQGHTAYLAFELVLDRTRRGGELQPERHSAGTAIDSHVLHEAARHNVHAKVRVDDAREGEKDLPLSRCWSCLQKGWNGVIML